MLKRFGVRFLQLFVRVAPVTPAVCARRAKRRRNIHVISDKVTRLSAALVQLVKHFRRFGDHSRFSPFIKVSFKRTTATLFDTRREIVADGQGLAEALASSRSDLSPCVPGHQLSGRPEAEVFDRLNGPKHSNTPRYYNRPSGIRLRVCLR
jgi:hypothetical protein